ncbi:MAG: hypothetical protein KatS3mg123_0761 [Burkholderiales bacterium]|nr:MAG: hypothetical protein KatS3mg123_0761 [Burkholderiales bacterium]
MQVKPRGSGCIKMRTAMRSVPILAWPLKAALAVFVILSLLVQNLALAGTAVHYHEVPATAAVSGLTAADDDCRPGGTEFPKKPCDHLASCHAPCSMQALPSGFSPVPTPSPALYDFTEATRYVAFIPELPNRPPLA